MITVKPPLVAFHGDPKVKEMFLNRVKAHRKAENLIQNFGYWHDGRGCAVGCTLEMGFDEIELPHTHYPAQLGLPEWLAHLEDRIFESLPKEIAVEWPERLLSAIQPGQEVTDAVRDRFQIWWHDQNLSFLDENRDAEQIAAIHAVQSLLSDAVNGNEPESAEWLAAESAARSATRSVAESAAWAAAWSAARSAAWSAARSVAESAAWAQSDKLIELLLEGGNSIRPSQGEKINFWSKAEPTKPGRKDN